MTGKKDPTEQLKDYVQLSFFADIGKAIASSTTIKETLKEVMSQIGNIFAPLNWSLLLRNSRSGELTFTTVIGSGVDGLRGKTIPRGQGVAGWIAENVQPVIIEDVAIDERFDPSMDELTGFTTKSIIGVPLKSHDRVFGVIELVNKLNGESFTPLELRTLSTIADFAAIAIEKAYYLRALKRVALVDPLTGAYNRRSMTGFLDREINRCHRNENTFSLLMIDVDHFKDINDTFGHLAGDQVLKAVTELLKDNVRKVDLVCRYGGDEFVVIMPDTSAEQGEQAKGRIEEAIDGWETPIKRAVTISVGIFSGCPESMADIFKSADLDMYRSKSNRVERDIDDMTENLRELLEYEADRDEGAEPK